MIENGTLDIMLDKESPYKFEDYAKMFEKSIARKAKGKLVIKVSDDVNNANDEQKNDVKEEVNDDKKDEKDELYKINKGPKDDVSDNETEEVVSNAKNDDEKKEKEKKDDTAVVEKEK